MHEFGLCEAIVAAIQRRAAGRRVARVRVRAGAIHRLDKGVFQQAFSWAAVETEAQDAAVDLVITAVRVRCLACAHETESDEMIAACARCGALNVEIVQGSEMILEFVEYEGAES
jgi:hydrogenase nickel incorporation protein HypA/HybF